MGSDASNGIDLVQAAYNRARDEIKKAASVRMSGDPYQDYPGWTSLPTNKCLETAEFCGVVRRLISIGHYDMACDVLMKQSNVQGNSIILKHNIPELDEFVFAIVEHHLSKKRQFVEELETRAINTAHENARLDKSKQRLEEFLANALKEREKTFLDELEKTHAARIAELETERESLAATIGAERNAMLAATAEQDAEIAEQTRSLQRQKRAAQSRLNKVLDQIKKGEAAVKDGKAAIKRIDAECVRMEAVARMMADLSAEDAIKNSKRKRIGFK